MSNWSIKKRVFFNFGLISLLDLLMITLVFFGLSRSRMSTKRIISSSEQVKNLNHLSNTFNQLETSIDGFVLTGAAYEKDQVKVGFDNLHNTYDLMFKNRTDELMGLGEIEVKIHNLKSDVGIMLYDFGELSSKEQNLLMVSIYSKALSIKEESQVITERTIEDINNQVIAHEKDIFVMTQMLTLIGIIILVSETLVVLNLFKAVTPPILELK